jgi:hypothetical protein
MDRLRTGAATRLPTAVGQQTPGGGGAKSTGKVTSTFVRVSTFSSWVCAVSAVNLSANDPAAWAAEVRRNALTKSAKEEERARGMTAAFVETEKAQANVEKLSARMQLLGLDHGARLLFFCFCKNK